MIGSIPILLTIYSLNEHYITSNNVSLQSVISLLIYPLTELFINLKYMKQLPKTIYLVIDDIDDGKLYLEADEKLENIGKTYYSEVGKYEFVEYVNKDN